MSRTTTTTNNKNNTQQKQERPLHLDKAERIDKREPYEFYDTFVDLYLLGMSKCVTYNRGGYGQWASLISYNVSCYHNIKTSTAGIGSPCRNWTTTTTTMNDMNNNQGQSILYDESLLPPLFLDPM